MGLSIKRGNGGYIGIDTRINTTGSVGSLSIKKYYLSRLSGAYAPIGANILFSDNFETGTLSKWTLANEGGTGTSKSDWSVGTNQAASGSYSAYISDNDGVTAQYYGSAQRDSHMYFDVAIPSSATSLTLEFDWKCNGESTYDYGYINYWNTTTTPVAGTLYTSTTDRIGASAASGRFNDTYKVGADLNWFHEIITINGTAGNGPLFTPGTTQRIVFSWTNDSSLENNPGFCVDNIILKYN